MPRVGKSRRLIASDAFAPGRCRHPIIFFMSYAKNASDIKNSLSYAVIDCSLATRALVPRSPTPLVRTATW
ncbi:MAG: hypothetical protein ACRD6X_06910 [Pyrinomonadaceae bacterium]